MAVQHVCFRGCVSAVSRRMVRAPFALTFDGTFLVNVATLTNATDLESIVRAAQDEKRGVLVGFTLSPREATLATARLDNAADETAARIVGKRRRRRRPRAVPT